MMLTEKMIGSTKFIFVCRTEDTRNGFKHVCDLYKGEYKINTAVCHYLNRSWENYRYQTAMKKAVDNLLQDREDTLLNTYKAQNDIKRMTAVKRAEFEKSLEADSVMNTYKELRATL